MKITIENEGMVETHDCDRAVVMFENKDEFTLIQKNVNESKEC